MCSGRQVCGSIACSIAINGVFSDVLEGLIVPKKAANSNTIRLCENAKASPPRAINRAKQTSISRLPRRSAKSVTKIISITLPTSATLRSRLTCTSDRPSVASKTPMSTLLKPKPNIRRMRARMTSRPSEVIQAPVLPRAGI